MENIFSLYYPILISAILIIIIYNQKLTEQIKLPLKFLEVFQIDLPIHSKYIKGFFILLAVCFPLYCNVTRDYSRFFPKEFSMEVFYDKEGINETLDTYSPADLENLGVQKDLSIRDTVYFSKLDEEIRKINIANNFFTRKDCIIHSTGSTNFKVEKVDGLQKYHVYESKGELQHFLECSQEKQVCLKSFFEKLPSNSDYITGSFSSIIIIPKFKQTIAEKNRSDGIIFNHILYGLTKIKIFPTITYSNTLYLFEYNGKLYPIGYAVYKE